MRIICKLSGVEFETFTHFRKPEAPEHEQLANNFSTLRVGGIHPIFSIPTTELLACITSWSQRKLTRKDARILFLALLHRTELAEFRVVPAPSDQTIAANMGSLARTLAWQSALNPSFLKLSRYAITTHNRKLEFISQWIEKWNEDYQAWKNNRERTQLISAADGRAALLEKLIKSATKTTENYAETLAKWAFDASGLPNKSEGDKIIRERWLKLFKLRGLSVFNANTAHIEDMLEWFEENLNLASGDIIAYKVLEHIRKLYNYNTRGLEAALGFIDGSTFQMVEPDAIETHNKKVIIASAPAEEPTDAMIPSVYKNKVAMLAARAAWRLAQSAAKQSENKVAELEKKLDASASALLDLQEDQEDSLEQLTIDFKTSMNTSTQDL